jgi:PIN domain nuclease of toxin-antitoxin system
MALDGAIAHGATELPDLHPDPADRFIVATALTLGATLLTADQAILSWPGPLRRQRAGE